MLLNITFILFMYFHLILLLLYDSDLCSIVLLTVCSIVLIIRKKKKLYPKLQLNLKIGFGQFSLAQI